MAVLSFQSPTNFSPTSIPRSSRGRFNSTAGISSSFIGDGRISSMILRFPPNFVRQLSIKARRNCSNIGVAQIVAAKWSNNPSSGLPSAAAAASSASAAAASAPAAAAPPVVALNGVDEEVVVAEGAREIGLKKDSKPSFLSSDGSLTVHAGERLGRGIVTDAITTPVVNTSAYFFNKTADLIDFKEKRSVSFEYGRYGNPTTIVLEEKISALEGSESTLVMASGMCASTVMLLALVPAGGHIVTTTDCYRKTRIFMENFLPKMGITKKKKMEGSGGGRGGGVESILPNYKLGRTLGIGSFGRVKIAEHSLTGHKVAIKILNRRKIKNMEMEEKVRREIKILRLFMHPHIIRLYEVIETPTDIYLVLEYVNSGELFDYIVEKGRLQEDEARNFFQQIISGVEYCHRNMVVHRDLKPENLLLGSKSNVKIADFGLSNIMRDGHFLKTSCGSPNYAAPEVISGKLYAGPEVDVWSCGVILYALLCGTLPFDDENIPNLFKKIKGGIYTLPSHLSAGARDLIPRMLVVDPMKRVTIPEIRQHHWFQAHLPRYLAVPPPDTAQQAKKIDEEILQEVVSMGFDRNLLIESLRNRTQNDGTVTYYLILDNRFRVSAGYLGAEFQETMEGTPRMHPAESVASPVANRLPGMMEFQGVGLRSQYPVERKWALGLQSRAHPREIMTEVLKALQDLSVCWKKIGPYNMKCRWVPNNGDGMLSNSMQDNNYFGDDSSIIENDSAVRSPNVVKFELQLYKTRDDKYLLDLQRVQGPQFLFLDLCAAFLAQLRVL